MVSAPARAGVVLSLQIFWLSPRLLRPKLPFLFKLMPPEDVSKKVLIELCLFTQNPDALAILAASCLQTNGEQMLASQHASRHIFIHNLLRFIERFFNQGVVGGEKLYRHAFDPDTFVLLLGIAAGAQRIIQRGEREQTTGCLRQNNKDIEIEGQERFRIEGRGHRAADGVTSKDAIVFQPVKDLQRGLHTARITDLALQVIRDFGELGEGGLEISRILAQ
jgi:hypothetical protein